MGAASTRAANGHGIGVDLLVDQLKVDMVWLLVCRDWSQLLVWEEFERVNLCGGHGSLDCVVLDVGACCVLW